MAHGEVEGEKKEKCICCWGNKSRLDSQQLWMELSVKSELVDLTKTEQASPLALQKKKKKQQLCSQGLKAVILLYNINFIYRNQHIYPPPP